jgi:hypothetical protein
VYLSQPEIAGIQCPSYVVFCFLKNERREAFFHFGSACSCPHKLVVCIYLIKMNLRKGIESDGVILLTN